MIKFKHVSKEMRKGNKGQIPVRMTESSAGYDFYLTEDIVLDPGETKLTFTNIKARMPKDMYLQLSIRSSLAYKKNIVLANSPAVIDADYYNNEDNEGNIGLILYNLSDAYTWSLKEGLRVAQGIFLEYHTAYNEAENKKKRESGFGSTGKEE